MKRFPLVIAALTVAAVGSTVSPLAHAAGTKKGAPAKAKAKVTAKAAPLPKYVSLATLKKLQAARARTQQTPPPVLQPKLDGHSLKGKNMKDLATNPPYIVVSAKMAEVEAGAAMESADVEVASPGESEKAATSMDGQLIAQAFPPAVPPASIRRTPRRTVVPQWVRYPLEFQLAGIGLGTKAVDKDRFNRIDRYGLFAMHGNPTAVVVPSSSGNITVTQQPPEVAGLFPSDAGGNLPDWAAAITVKLDNNHVQWLYRRETYSMGFVVDRLGFVDAIVVAGVYSPIAKTQLEDPIHTIQLGVDDFRKVVNRYGYPDSIETYEINPVAGSGISTGGGGAGAGGAEGDAGAGPGAAPGGLPGAGAGAPGPGGPGGGAPGLGGAGAGGGGGVTDANGAYRTFELRYEQSYNIVFTIRNNRVVRIYIFGDPDFFNAQRRNALRTKY